VLRSLHEATGVSIWIATFALAYLARIASGGSAVALVDRSGASPAALDARESAATMGHSVAVIVARGADA
jgi:hypothetical protein